MIKCEFIDRKGFRQYRVLDEAPPYYSIATLPGFKSESWFSDGEAMEPTIKLEQLMFQLKSRSRDFAKYEEM